MNNKYYNNLYKTYLIDTSNLKQKISLCDGHYELIQKSTLYDNNKSYLQNLINFNIKTFDGSEIIKFLVSNGLLILNIIKIYDDKEYRIELYKQRTKITIERYNLVKKTLIENKIYHTDLIYIFEFPFVSMKIINNLSDLL